MMSNNCKHKKEIDRMGYKEMEKVFKEHNISIIDDGKVLYADFYLLHYTKQIDAKYTNADIVYMRKVIRRWM